ncbi:MAG: hypothetical protein JRI22_03020 [Deltaproteobacteria bacterium]|nr:hypothetical protein [Deltaproteobacteria bacterium]
MKNEKAHSYIPELLEQFEKGKLTRREFLRYTALLGMSVSAASSLILHSFPGSIPRTNCVRWPNISPTPIKTTSRIPIFWKIGRSVMI